MQYTLNKKMVGRFLLHAAFFASWQRGSARPIRALARVLFSLPAEAPVFTVASQSPVYLESTADAALKLGGPSLLKLSRTTLVSPPSHGPTNR